MVDARLPSILIVDDIPDAVCTIVEVLSRAGYRTLSANSAMEANGILEDEFVDLALVDEKLGPGESGTKLLERWRNKYPGLGSIVITGHGDLDTAVGAMRAGALDFLQKPVKTQALEEAVRRALELSVVARAARFERWEAQHNREFPEIVGTSDALRRVLDQIPQIAAGPAPVLIQGETGTGKEAIARAIHARSPRRNKKFIAVNSGGMAPTLLESDLFGTRRGAFTGAVDKAGLFEAASGGTLFLDEIGEITAELQVRLLRVLQSGVITRLGDTREISVDTRVVAATNRNLRKEVDEKRFRSDLYYRLAVVTLDMPPLRERTSDIPALARHLVGKWQPFYRGGPHKIGPDALGKLQQYRWPGNIRELENVIQRAMMLGTGDTITVESLNLEANPRAGDFEQLLALDFRSAERAFERIYFSALLDRAAGNKTKAAELAGMDRTVLYAHLSKLH